MTLEYFNTHTQPLGTSLLVKNMLIKHSYEKYYNLDLIKILIDF